MKEVDRAVLYYDHSSYPTPISNLYHATGSRQLSSSLTPESSIEEIESSYCTQCLSTWDATTAFGAGGVCRSSSILPSSTLSSEEESSERVSSPAYGCTSCPMCGSILVLSVQETHLFQDNNDDDMNHESTDEKADYLCMYKCGYCQWTSYECGIATPVRLHDGKNQEDNNEMEHATKRIQEQLGHRLFSQQQKSTELVQSLVKGWKKVNVQQDRQKRQLELMISPRGKSGKVANSFVESESRKDDDKLSTLESIVERIEVSTNHKRRDLSEIVVKSVIPDEDEKLCTLQLGEEKSDVDKRLNDTESVTSQNVIQGVISSSIVASQENVLPVPLSLRAKSIRRCAFELKAGRTGILVKPKVNPLEGDTSLRFGHGQWWKKDSSAIHTIPRVSIHKYGFDEASGRYALLLKVKNPTISMVRLRLTATETSMAQDNETLPLVLDSSSMKTVHAHVISPTKDECRNEMVYIELDPYEDVFLGLGKSGATRTPTAIDQWNASKCVGSFLESKDALSRSSCTLVAKHRDVAYIQYVVPPEKDVSTYQTLYVATPLTLSIDTTDGSWESSLTQDEQNGEIDKVDLQLLPVWRIMRK